MKETRLVDKVLSGLKAIMHHSATAHRDCATAYGDQLTTKVANEVYLMVVMQVLGSTVVGGGEIWQGKESGRDQADNVWYIYCITGSALHPATVV